MWGKKWLFQGSEETIFKTLADTPKNCQNRLENVGEIEPATFDPFLL